MTWLLSNILMVIPFLALWVGIPMWLVLKHPDTGPQPEEPSALAHLSARPHDDPGYPRAA